MNNIKQVFDKNTSHGRAIRTALQAFIAIITFVSGLMAIPGFGGFLADNNVMTLATFGIWIGIVSYIQNALENFSLWLEDRKEPF